ncbi:unnamed protein product [Eruca vesicaria subsp. sativa]|uniref:Auxin response factor domain-containing protein n=1 Tax=Eruca vesicaria subsp. sativa TaxID=29727 RepID=A0ABC8L8Y3_ERUVS|nr:unnamed protein product [Eruca vesicaria subsp. sativa]
MHIGILAAAAHANANSSPFTIFFNPRASPSEFVVPLAKYNKALYSQVSLGMRFRMMFETEDCGVRRYMGTVTGISDLDPVRWKGSQWHPLALRLLYRLLAFDPKDRPAAEEALADPYFYGLANVEREPSTQPIPKLEFEFERRKIMKEDVRELIYKEILEYHPQMLPYKVLHFDIRCVLCWVTFLFQRERERVLAPKEENNLQLLWPRHP